MKTSCFKKYKGKAGISIALYPPAEWDGPHYLALRPGRHLLTAIKIGSIDEKEYEKRYRGDVLFFLDPQKVYDDLSKSVLLCYEAPGEFCHRRIVAKWIFEEIGKEVPEWNIEDDNPKKKTKSLF